MVQCKLWLPLVEPQLVVQPVLQCKLWLPLVEPQLVEEMVQCKLWVPLVDPQLVVETSSMLGRILEVEASSQDPLLVQPLG